MKKLFWMPIVLLTASLAWGQNGPAPNGPGPNGSGPNGPKGPPPLTDQGFSDAEAKAVEADLKKWEQANREWDADLQVLDAQRNRAMLKDSLDKGELEKAFRAQYDLLLKRELGRIDLVIQWRSKYGVEKSRFLEGRLRGPQGQPGQPGQPNQPGQPGQPQGPGPGPGAGPAPAP